MSEIKPDKVISLMGNTATNYKVMDRLLQEITSLKSGILEIVTDHPHVMTRLKYEEGALQYKILKIVEDRPVKTINKWTIVIKKTV